MAQAAWVPSSSDRRSVPATPMAASPQPIELARWELAEFLKSSSSLARDPVHPQSQAMFTPSSLNSVFASFGNNTDANLSSMSHNQPSSHTGSINNGANRSDPLNNAAQSYDPFPPTHATSPSSDSYTSASSSPNYGLANPGIYGSGPIHDGLSSFHSPNPFSMSPNMPASFAQKLSLDHHLDGLQHSQDFSFSTMSQNHATSSMPDLRRLSTNGFPPTAFPDDFGINVTSNLGMSMSPLNMRPHLHLHHQQQQQQQPQPQQFSDGYGRFQSEGQYSPSPDRPHATSHFSQTHSSPEMSSQTNTSFPQQQQNFDSGMSSYMSGPMGTNSSDVGLANAIVESGTRQVKLQAPTAGISDFQTFIRPYLDQYVRTSNRLAFGERTIIVMSSKVAQKSYGNEKRFLCPPPTAIMVGNAWWTNVHRPGEGPKSVAPKVVISISGEPSPQESSVEWAGAAGKTFDTNDPPTGTTYVGRCVGKQLYISEADEKRKKVDALVKITAVSDNDEEKVIGVFSSKSIKVISKPSKKRQSAKNLELCINHGSTVSLFHRLRSQTVSTKYLCVSASGSSFKGSDGAPLLGTDVRACPTVPAFVARTSSWDPFIMYIVDVSKPPGGMDSPPPSPPQPDYPSPPPNAIPFTNNGSQIPIYYNQTIVLQCLTSGVVSPILIIRKVDHQTTVVGGGNQEGGKAVPDHYCAPGEVYGDPVSQLHKIAFEVYEPSKNVPEPGSPGVSGAFLSCMAEKVNTYRPVDGRQWNRALSRGSVSPVVPGSPSLSTPPPSASVDYFGLEGAVPPSPSEPDIQNTNDGGKVRKGKRATSSAGGITKNSSGKPRKRPNSAGSAGGRRPPTIESSGNAGSGALWQVDIGETSVWTIVGTEQIRYDFYVPPVLFDQQNSQSGSSITPSKPVTPFPGVVKYLPPDRASEAPSRHNFRNDPPPPKMLTLYGENFLKSDPVHVFFGSEPSSYAEIRCSEVITALPPEIETAKRRPIILVRYDGVVFPSSTMYP